MRSLLPLCIFLSLFAAGFGPSAAAGAGAATTFTPDPLRVGDTMRYDGSGRFNVTVDAPAPVLDRAFRSVPAAVLRHVSDSGRESHVAMETATGRAAYTDTPCYIAASGSCLPWMLRTWSTQGLAPLFGATLLPGRTFSFGDTWAEGGDCAWCIQPLQYEILAPLPTSPPGTAYVVDVDVQYRYLTTRHLGGPAVLHMDATSPYPLRIDTDGMSFALVSHTVGSTPLPTPSAIPAYSAPAAAQPYDSGLPPEGTPLPGHPSWLEARRQTQLTMQGPTDASLGPITRLTYVIAETRVQLAPNTPKHVAERDYTWRVSTDRPTGDTRTMYTTSTPYPDHLPTPPPRVWSAATTPTTDASATGCATAAVPLWDHVRLAQQTGHLSSFTEFSLAGNCDAFLVTVLGTLHLNPEVSFGHKEEVTLDHATGLLRNAVIWTGAQ